MKVSHADLAALEPTEARELVVYAWHIVVPTKLSCAHGPAHPNGPAERLVAAAVDVWLIVRTGRVAPPKKPYGRDMLILAIIVFGMLAGAGAQLILGRPRGPIDWTTAIVAGLVGSFVGGLLISLLSGDGLDLKPSGLIGSLIGAIVVTAGWSWWEDRNRPTAADRAAKRSGDPRKRNPR